MSTRKQHPRTFSEFITVKTSVSWTRSFISKIAVIVYDVNEQYTGFIHLNYNIIDTSGTSPMIVIVTVETINDNRTSIALIILSRGTNRKAVAQISAGVSCGAEYIINVYEKVKVLSTLRTALITRVEEYTTTIEEDLPMELRAASPEKTEILPNFDASLN